MDRPSRWKIKILPSSMRKSRVALLPNGPHLNGQGRGLMHTRTVIDPSLKGGAFQS